MTFLMIIMLLIPPMLIIFKIAAVLIVTVNVSSLIVLVMDNVSRHGFYKVVFACMLAVP